MCSSTDGSKLLDDLGAIAPFLHHALHTSGLPLNASQKRKHFLSHLFWEIHVLHSLALKSQRLSGECFSPPSVRTKHRKPLCLPWSHSYQRGKLLFPRAGYHTVGSRYFLRPT